MLAPLMGAALLGAGASETLVLGLAVGLVAGSWVLIGAVRLPRTPYYSRDRSGCILAGAPHGRSGMFLACWNSAHSHIQAVRERPART
jgi:hypothetical protein